MEASPLLLSASPTIPTRVTAASTLPSPGGCGSVTSVTRESVASLDGCSPETLDGRVSHTTETARTAAMVCEYDGMAGGMMGVAGEEFAFDAPSPSHLVLMPIVDTPTALALPPLGEEGIVQVETQFVSHSAMRNSSSSIQTPTLHAMMAQGILHSNSNYADFPVNNSMATTPEEQTTTQLNGSGVGVLRVDEGRSSATRNAFINHVSDGSNDRNAVEGSFGQTFSTSATQIMVRPASSTSTTDAFAQTDRQKKGVMGKAWGKVRRQLLGKQSSGLTSRPPSQLTQVASSATSGAPHRRLPPRTFHENPNVVVCENSYLLSLPLLQSGSVLPASTTVPVTALAASEPRVRPIGMVDQTPAPSPNAIDEANNNNNKNNTSNANHAINSTRNYGNARHAEIRGEATVVQDANHLGPSSGTHAYAPPYPHTSMNQPNTTPLTMPSANGGPADEWSAGSAVASNHGAAPVGGIGGQSEDRGNSTGLAAKVTRARAAAFKRAKAALRSASGCMVTQSPPRRMVESTARPRRLGDVQADVGDHPQQPQSAHGQARQPQHEPLYGTNQPRAQHRAPRQASVASQQGTGQSSSGQPAAPQPPSRHPAHAAQRSSEQNHQQPQRDRGYERQLRAVQNFVGGNPGVNLRGQEQARVMGRQAEPQHLNGNAGAQHTRPGTRTA